MTSDLYSTGSKIAADFPLLAKIDSPADVRALDPDQLPTLAAELRRFLIETVSRTGGHLAAGLGTVELTVALHYLFETPHDRLVWDIGHQAYPHKILTGRRDQLDSIRQPDGLSGFLSRTESDYDTFGAGHSSTSISAALGMAAALAHKRRAESNGAVDESGHNQSNDQNNSDDSRRQVVAVIGDGALTAGMAYEALNNAGDMDADLLVVLNDNDMSISPNVGAISNYLARILSGQAYTTVRGGSKTVLSTMPPVHDLARRWEEHMKGMVMPSTLFEELGFNYIGPIDGHNVDTLVKTLANMRSLKGPRFLHVVTQKGKGYEPAEGDPCVYHAVTPFDPSAGKLESKSSAKSYTSVFSDWLCDMAARDRKLIGITPAMREGSGLVKFSEVYPDRYVDVGIAEQHALTFAAGMACEGLKPVVAIYSTFLQRAYDQLVHDISVQNLNVMLAVDRAGLVGADGPTHAGAYDLSFLRCIPNMVIMAPSDENECRQMLYTAYEHEGPTAVRYPRGSGPGVAVEETMSLIPIGAAEIRREGQDIALLAFGSMLAPCLEAATTLNATVVNMRFVKPLDESMIKTLAQTHRLLVTVEENAVMGGAGSAVNEVINQQGLSVKLLNLGLPDKHIDHGKPAQMLADCGLDAAGIAQSVLKVLPRPVADVAS